jgi:hypothetical protein
MRRGPPSADWLKGEILKTDGPKVQTIGKKNLAIRLGDTEYITFMRFPNAMQQRVNVQLQPAI